MALRDLAREIRSRASARGARWLVERRVVDRVIGAAEQAQSLAEFVRDLESGILHFGVLPSRHDVRRLQREVKSARERLDALERTVEALEEAIGSPGPGDLTGPPSSRSDGP